VIFTEGTKGREDCAVKDGEKGVRHDYESRRGNGKEERGGVLRHPFRGDTQSTESHLQEKGNPRLTGQERKPDNPMQSSLHKGTQT